MITSHLAGLGRSGLEKEALEELGIIGLGHEFDRDKLGSLGSILNPRKLQLVRRCTPSLGRGGVVSWSTRLICELNDGLKEIYPESWSSKPILEHHPYEQQQSQVHPRPSVATTVS